MPCALFMIYETPSKCILLILFLFLIKSQNIRHRNIRRLSPIRTEADTSKPSSLINLTYLINCFFSKCYRRCYRVCHTMINMQGTNDVQIADVRMCAFLVQPPSEFAHSHISNRQSNFFFLFLFLLNSFHVNFYQRIIIRACYCHITRREPRFFISGTIKRLSQQITDKGENQHQYKANASAGFMKGWCYSTDRIALPNLSASAVNQQGLNARNAILLTHPSAGVLT